MAQTMDGLTMEFEPLVVISLRIFSVKIADILL